MIKISKNREKYLLEKYFGTRNKKNIPPYLSQFGCRDGNTEDEDLFFITRYVMRIDRLAIGGSLVTEHGLPCLAKLRQVTYLDLRSMPLNDDNLDCILQLEDLEYLYIKFTGVTAAGISRILSSLPRLQTLIAEVHTSDSGLIALWQKKYPDLELVISLNT